MYIALIILHVSLCVLLIVTILLQAGRGGGLTEMFGGETAQSVLGTQAPALLKKITEISALGFIITSLALGMVTSRRGQSLFEGRNLPFSQAGQTTAALPLVPESQGERTAQDVTAELPPVEPLAIPGTAAKVSEEPAASGESSSAVKDLVETAVNTALPVEQTETKKEGDL